MFTLHRMTSHFRAFRGTFHRYKTTIDTSKVPALREEDLEETFVRGSGPGGQSVAKTNNKAVLTHKPTGIVIQCHASRSLFKNREEARRLLVLKLDELENGDQSVESQQKKIDLKKHTEAVRRKFKRQEMKKVWKEREFGSEH
ncbi:mitochondrial translation release factor in rescue [Ochlerotatus camptorhynchus]|uniref:mitochondrial translation release factor in rescue n=1 Tax=Ochlerotatus camptorhynchus TaxID=644619 RepID=UPI0031D1E2E5